MNDLLSQVVVYVCNMIYCGIDETCQVLRR
jgi:hypothetical protein